MSNLVAKSSRRAGMSFSPANGAGNDTQIAQNEQGEPEKLVFQELAELAEIIINRIPMASFAEV